MLKSTISHHLFRIENIPRMEVSYAEEQKTRGSYKAYPSFEACLKTILFPATFAFL